MVGDNIRNLRLRYNLTQQDLAKIAGVTNKAISSWEHNRTEPRMGAIQKIADHFGIKKSDILEPPELEIIETEEAKLMAGYHNLSDEGKQLIMRMIEQLNFKRTATSSGLSM